MRRAIATRRGRLVGWSAGLAVVAALLAVGLSGKGAAERPAPRCPRRRSWGGR